MPSIIPITDPEDPRIAPYRDIRERDLVGREGYFMAEGGVVLKVLLGGSSRHQTVSLLLAERRVASLGGLIAGLPDDVPVYSAATHVIEAIAGMPMHRGILALGQRVPVVNILPPLDRPALVVGLVGIANHDNIGGIFRNAAAFGADAVILDATCCDPLYRKAIRVSVGGTLVVPFMKLGPGEDMIELLANAEIEPLALSPAGTTVLAALQRPRRVAILLGAEGPGLSTELMARARTIGIPMAAGFNSLNVATTSGIVLHHLTSTLPDGPDASAAPGASG